MNITNRDITNEDIANKDIIDKNIFDRNIADRDPIIDIYQNLTSSIFSSRTSILIILIVHLVNDNATTGMLTDLVNETKILFLKAHNSSHSA
ncbi:454_t:CDS:2 [Funneliformis caledonium]|uniref:454_t:CDS:1 n=1 Tax=Funneliformis caledonium TaxID=1117310 RepID=A0A9N8W9B2_9GLOM|nr:454_t:CDS:2 [Funneliformis caledonium]